MSAKAYDKKTAAFAGFLIQNVPDGLTDEVMQGWMDNPSALKRLLAGLVPSGGVAADSFCYVLATTALAASATKKTSKCLTGPRWDYREGGFDNWFPVNQPKADASEISTIGFKRGWTFAEAVEKVLGLAIPGASIKLLGQKLIAGGHTMTLVQLEDMVEATERGENTGMRTNGYASLCFVETGNEEGPVSVARVNSVDSRWGVSIVRLGEGFRRNAGYRLLVRNLDASKLGS